MRTIVAVVLAAFSAYATSFVLDMLFGGMAGTYSPMPFLPICTWAMFASVAFVLMLGLSARPLAVWGPFAAFALLSVFGALVGAHAHNWLVAGGMAVVAVVVRRGATDQVNGFGVLPVRLALRNSVVYALTLCAGLAGAAFVAWLVGLVAPAAKVWVFALLAAYWTLTGLRYAKVRLGYARSRPSSAL